MSWLYFIRPFLILLWWFYSGTFHSYRNLFLNWTEIGNTGLPDNFFWKILKMFFFIQSSWFKLFKLLTEKYWTRLDWKATLVVWFVSKSPDTYRSGAVCGSFIVNCFWAFSSAQPLKFGWQGRGLDSALVIKSNIKDNSAKTPTQLYLTHLLTVIVCAMKTYYCQMEGFCKPCLSTVV